jgi:hypothetical protein
MTAVATGLIDLAIITGYVPTESKGLFIVLLNGIAGTYIAVEGIIDLYKKEKTQ